MTPTEEGIADEVRASLLSQGPCDAGRLCGCHLCGQRSIPRDHSCYMKVQGSLASMLEEGSKEREKREGFTTARNSAADLRRSPVGIGVLRVAVAVAADAT